MSFAVVLQAMSIVAYMIILGGGKRLRENGWRVLSILILLSAVIQAASMSIVVRSYFELSGEELCANSLGFRHTSLTMKIGSSLVGNWMSPGSIALLACALV
jgi:hypothetical protein